MRRKLIPVLPLLLLAVGCPVSRTIVSTDGSTTRLDGDMPPADAPTGPRDGGPIVGPDGGPPVCLPETESVDLLLVIDNSNSMSEEQASLAMTLPSLVRALTTGDLNGDGILDFTPVGSLQVGVLTTDMGTGGFRVPTCAEPNFGDDGILRTQGNTTIPGCMATYPPFLAFRPADGGDPDAFGRDVSCVAVAGTGGCGFEQQLDSALKGITPSTSPIAFPMGTTGHGDTANRGFVRPDSVLAVVFVSDEEDCSAADPELFNPSSAVYTGDLNLRCFSFPAAVHPVSRYVEGLLAIRRGIPGRLVYGGILGIPERLAGASTRTILSDPEMQEMVDPTMPTRLRPSCNVPGRGLAFPPRRFVQLAEGLQGRGAHTTIQSICQYDFTEPIREIVRQIGDATRPTCP